MFSTLLEPPLVLAALDTAEGAADATGLLDGALAGDALADVSSLVVSILLVVLALLGLGMWLLGRRLARPACTVSGLVLGGLGGLALGEMLAEQGAFTIPLVIGAAIAGALLAALLFRIWMAISGAALLALVVPAAMVIWQNTPLPAPEETEATEQAQETEHETTPGLAPGGEPLVIDENLDSADSEALLHWLERLTGIDLEGVASTDVDPDADPDATDHADAADPDAEDADSSPGTLAGEQIEAVIGEGSAAVRAWYAELRERLRAWWSELSPAARRGLFVGAGIGALLGLTLGLALPYTAAALQSALAGSILVFLPLRELLARHAPEWTGLLPQSPRATLLWLGLITVLGVLLQWTLFRRRADK